MPSGERMGQRGGYAAAVRGGGNNQGESLLLVIKSSVMFILIFQVEDRISSEKRPIYSYKLINVDCQE